MAWIVQQINKQTDLESGVEWLQGLGHAWIARSLYVHTHQKKTPLFIDKTTKEISTEDVYQAQLLTWQTNCHTYCLNILLTNQIIILLTLCISMQQQSKYPRNQLTLIIITKFYHPFLPAVTCNFLHCSRHLLPLLH